MVSVAEKMEIPISQSQAEFVTPLFSSRLFSNRITQYGEPKVTTDRINIRIHCLANPR
jgi:hypothetical protein